MVAAVRNAPAPKGEVSRVLVDLQPGEALCFAEAGITVRVIAKSGRSTKLCVVAPRSLKIERQQVRALDTSMAG